MNDVIDYESITGYYWRRSSEIVLRYKAPIVLKTDLFNEANSIPMSGGIIGNIKAKRIHAIEIDEAVVEKAQAIFDLMPDIVCRQGDIRKLEVAYQPDSFDVILDLSTLDHVWPEEMPQVIAGYNRVLKNGGTILLIVWADTNKDYTEHEIGKFQQCMLGEDQIEKELSRYFKIESVLSIFGVPSRPEQQLLEFILTK